MGRDPVIPQAVGLITHPPDKFREINIGRTPDTALSASQAVPYGFIRRFLQFIKCARNNMPGGRKIRENLGNRATSGTNTAIKAVIGICGINKFT